MQDILDIHTHREAPQPQAIVCADVRNFLPIEGQLYSAGIHPWDTTDDIPDRLWSLIEEACADPHVAAIGECGIDREKGGPLFRQMLVMKRHIELSESLGKPLIIHNVHAHDVIIGLKKEMKPSQNWAIHGFRGKPTVARMLTDAGIWLSFGARFNERTAAEAAEDIMLAETDESDADIHDIISSLSALRGKDMTPTIAENARRFLGLPNTLQ